MMAVWYILLLPLCLELCAGDPVRRESLPFYEGGEEAYPGVPGGWHGRNVSPQDYDPVKECRLPESHGVSRFLYCPAFAMKDQEPTTYCCGDETARKCCTAKDWKGEQAAKLKKSENRKSTGPETSGKGGPEVIDEIHEGWHEATDSLPDWAIVLIVLGALILAIIIIYIFFKCLMKLLYCLCCCCCCTKKEEDKEKVVLIHSTHHTTSYQTGETDSQYRANAPPAMMTPADQPKPELYTNLTGSPPPPYTTHNNKDNLYPKLS